MNNIENQEDNIVSYALFPCMASNNLKDLINIYVAYLNSKFKLHEHIWQHECIRFWTSKDTSSLHICGWVKYGHNIEDEWLIVFLLMELTKKYEDLIIRVYDDDGEFLLIETADVLPKWLNPETGENKVFLFRGYLHILPKTFESKSLLEGVNYIRNNFDKTLASDKIQNIILKRISGYPNNITKLMHHSYCFLPVNLAIILNLQPGLVAHITEAYCLKDDIDLKACINPTKFLIENLIKRRVKFNRCLYAQLSHSKFFTHTKSKFKNPLLATHHEFFQYELGLKLAMGAEILYFQGMRYKMDLDSYQINVQDKRWTHFVESLKNSGYFRQECEGSKGYCDLLQTAKIFFRNSVNLNEEDVEIPPGGTILDILNNINFEDEILKITKQKLLPQDDDSWMDIGPDDLDNMLSEMFPKQRVTNLENLAPTIDKFIQEKSTLNGVDLSHSDNNSIHLDPETFCNSIKSLLEDDKDKNFELSTEEEENDSDEDCSLGYDSDDYLPGYNGENKENKLSKIEEYMAEMDCQLAATEIGKSFLKMKGQSHCSKTKATLIDDFSAQSEVLKDNNNGQIISPYSFKDDRIITDYDEIKATQNGELLENKTKIFNEGLFCGGTKESTNLKHDNSDTLDVDFNLVSNFLDSYSEQCGLPGPVSNILNGLGLRLPFDK